jgi:hypothetical protein
LNFTGTYELSGADDIPALIKRKSPGNFTQLPGLYSPEHILT